MRGQWEPQEAESQASPAWQKRKTGATYSCIRGKDKLSPIPHCSLDQRRLSGKPQDIAFPPDDQGGSSLEEGADWLLAATDQSLNRERSGHIPASRLSPGLDNLYSHEAIENHDTATNLNVLRQITMCLK